MVSYKRWLLLLWFVGILLYPVYEFFLFLYQPRGLLFSLNGIFGWTWILTFNVVQFIIFSPLWLVTCVTCLRSLCLPTTMKIFSRLSSGSFLVLFFTFRPAIHLELIFIYSVKWRSGYISSNNWISSRHSNVYRKDPSFSPALQCLVCHKLNIHM